MTTLMDYEALSSKEKTIIDLFASINLYGKEGYGVPADMVCEWSVKSVKGLYSRFAANYDAPLAQRNVQTANVVTEIKESFLESILCDKLKSGEGHSSRAIKKESLDEIR